VIARSRRMGSELVSKKTRHDFREWFVSFNYLRGIDAAFTNADIERRSLPDGLALSGERRLLVEEYYASIDWTSHMDVRKVLDVYEGVLEGIEDQVLHQRLVQSLERDGYRCEQGRLVPTSADWDLAQVLGVAAFSDISHLQDQIDRIREAIDEDPGLAIGTSKELVETTCKTLLDAIGEPFDKAADVGKLVRQTCRALKLTPEDISDSAKGAESIRRVLGQLAAIATGLAELRNLYGTGHGKSSDHRGLQPRHARLAVSCAATFSTFLFETYHRQRADAASDKAS
jgi:hypothetical protein